MNLEKNILEDIVEEGKDKEVSEGMRVGNILSTNGRWMDWKVPWELHIKVVELIKESKK